jgi:flagellin-specific chaperone FliS
MEEEIKFLKEIADDWKELAKERKEISDEWKKLYIYLLEKLFKDKYPLTIEQLQFLSSQKQEYDLFK